MLKLYKFVYVADLIGAVLSLFAFVAFFTDWLPAVATPFFQNFGVEMMGTWVSIRVIDYLMLQRSKASATRTRVLRHSRFWMHQIAPFTASVTERDLRKLRLEYRYTTHMAPAWSKFLEKSENEKYERLVDLIGNCLERAGNIRDRTNKITQSSRRFTQLLEAKMPDIALPPEKNSPDRINALISYAEVRSILGYIEEIFHSYIHDYKAVMSEVKSKFFRLSSIIEELELLSLPISLLEIEDLLSEKESYDQAMIELENIVADLEADIREETAEE